MIDFLLRHNYTHVLLPPSQNLSLDYVFGYRGFDTRQNVCVGPDGGVVFHAAGVGVVYNTLTRAQSFYLEHTDDILCLSMCRNNKMAHIVATGRTLHLYVRTCPIVGIWC